MEALKTVFIFLFTFMVIEVSGQSFSYKIDGGKFDSIPNGEMLYLYKAGTDHDLHLLDSTVYDDGFVFTGHLSELSYGIISDKTAKTSMYFILEPGPVGIKQSGTTYEVSGGEQNMYKIKADSLSEKIWQFSFSIGDTARKYKDLGDTLLYRHYLNTTLFAQKEVFKTLTKYHLNHPESFAALSFLFGYKGDIQQDDFALLYENLSEELKDNSRGKVVKQFIDAETIKYAHPIVGQRDTSGKIYDISFPNGKYTLIDFWASWCGPCRKNNPELKAIYSQYKSKGFEIIGISSDKNVERWKQAIDDDRMDWLNLADLKGWANEYMVKNGVHILPTYILIDQEGLIILKENYLDKVRAKLSLIEQLKN